MQDTIPICPSQLSQHIALEALQHGQNYLQQQIAGLAHNREVIADALSPLGTEGHGWVGGEGAIYYWAKLPDQFGAESLTAAEHSSSGQTAGSAAATADEAVVEWLIRQYGVCIIPGAACGAPGYVRVAFANLKPEQCKSAAARLKTGLQQLVAMDQLLLV